MRTTLDLEDRVLRAAKRRAAEEGITLTRIIEDALRSYLVPRQPAPYKLEILSKRGHLTPGIDISDRDSVYEAMEET